ncbi:MAG: hypothetical protein HZA47_03230 [Planctomycetes bacterium]|uniref:hypothetical protein n=1 Tax=Candidatus Wunengus sp. YC65 TaxID=3367701 RepID=UPI001DB3C394|nr:hypothetical protein [Planctomycetota bacterium]
MGKILFGLIPSAIPGFMRYFFCLVKILFLFIAVNHSQSAAYSQQSSAAAPTVTTDTASRVTHNSATLRGTVNANGLSTTAWFQYRIVNGPSKSTFSTQTVIGTGDTEVNFSIIELLPGTTYYYRLAARNDAGTVYGDELPFTTTDMKTSLTADITAPTGSISINNGAYRTNSLTVTLELSAADNIGVTGYYFSTSAIPPSSHTTGWTSATPAINYKEDVSYTLSGDDGKNTVYVWYKDASGNISDVASDSIIVDTTPPTITIANPTSGSTYKTTSKTINISGIASDSTSEINNVVWSTGKGKDEMESKTISWTISNVDLLEGDNVITVKATDSLGNTGTATITITYAVGNNPPMVITGPATGITTDFATLTGTVNAEGLSTTAWFQYGTSSESYSHTSSIVNIDSSSVDTPINNHISGLLAGTTYYYRLAARNSAGAAYGAEMIFNTKPPKGKISGYVIESVIGKPIESVRLRLKGTKARKKAFKVIFSGPDGFFEFNELDADTFDIFAIKTGFEGARQVVEMPEGEENIIEIKLGSIQGEEQKKDLELIRK